MQLKVLTASFAEPIDHTAVKAFMGYLETDQDDIIDSLITAARMWFEDRTGMSVISKSYKAYFEKEDAENGWYELPVAPVLDTPAITVKVTGTSTTFQQKGLTKISICPDNVIGTVGVGTGSTPYYCEVTFQAGEANEAANQCIMSIISQIFNHREEGININFARLPFDTMQRINAMIVY
jgi:hypothetical protein